MKTIAPLLILCSTLAGHASAAESAWQNVAPDVAVRLVGGEVTSDGSSLVGLEIDMPADTHTYWRVPGETGLEPGFALDEADGVRLAEVHWPHPEIAITSGYVDYVYRGDTVLPISLDGAYAGATVEMSVLLGICAEICVPVTADLELSLGEADPGNALRLRQAMSVAPIAWDGETAPVDLLSYDAERKALRFRLLDSSIDPSTLIGVIGDGEPLLGPAEPDGDDGELAFALLQEESVALAGRTITFDFMTDKGAFRYTSQIPLQ